MKQNPNRLWLTVFVLGWLFDFLFWKHTPGISFAIFALSTLAGGIFLLRQAGVRPARNTLFIIPFIVFFAVFTFIRAEQLSIFLAHAFTLLCMVLMTVTWQGGRWLNYGLADFVTRLFALLGSLFARPLMFQAETSKLASEANPELVKQPSRFWPIVRGVLFAIPVFAFFAALLSSADFVFAARLDEVVKWFNIENLPEYIFRAILITITAYALAGVYLHAAYRSQDEKLHGLDKPLINPFFGFTEASIMLGSIVFLFATFVLIQFQYFFGGRANISVEGHTFAEYARSGFGELVTVAFFSLLLFFGLSVIVKRENEQNSKLFSGLGVVLFLLVGVMLVSAFQRLLLYEAAYGFTSLRIYTHVFIIWLAILLVATIWLDISSRQRLFALVGTLAAIGFAISLLMLNVDGFIVQQNVQRSVNGYELDAGYLASLSPDAIPVMAAFFQSDEIDLLTRERLGAALLCYQNRNKNVEDDSWQAFHLSRYNASLVLKGLDLSGYKADSPEYSYTIETPSGEVVGCYSSTYD